MMVSSESSIKETRARLAEAWRSVFWKEMANHGLGHLGIGHLTQHVPSVVWGVCVIVVVVVVKRLFHRP